MLVHFAEAMRPEPRPVAEEHARELSAVVLRRFYSDLPDDFGLHAVTGYLPEPEKTPR